MSIDEDVLAVLRYTLHAADGQSHESKCFFFLEGSEINRSS